MRISYNWLTKLSNVAATPSEIAERLTFAGLEVEAIRPVGQGLDRVVVAEVLASKPHPHSDVLRVLDVSDGTHTYAIVCGAPNAAPHMLIALALPGAQLNNGLTVKERSIANVLSQGMACSEAELDIGSDSSGLLALEAFARAHLGKPLAQALSLDDVIFELSLTPNRSDCLGHLGVAREVAVLFNQPFAPPTMPLGIELAQSSADIQVEIHNPEGCPRYSALVLNTVSVTPSPFWLRYTLHVLGERPINNVVDITNLVLLETGHPTHAFDLDTLSEHRIVVRRARQGETLRTLDGVDRVLSPEDLVICDAKRPVALAGIMGGETSAVSACTERVLLECALFEPRTVRRTARRLGLSTEASYRFERGVDPNNAKWVIECAASHLQQLAGAAPSHSALDVYPTPIEPASITLRKSRMAHVLGTSVNTQAAETLLAGLGCQLRSLEDGWQVECPTWRYDLHREIDLIEEYGRVVGYDQIPACLPHVQPHGGKETNGIELLRRKLRLAATTLGLSEAINYAFCSAKSLEKARVRAQAVPLLNPLSEEQGVMRTSLLPGLLHNVQLAQRHQVDGARLFEVGRVFYPKPSAELPLERLTLDFVLAGQRRTWISKEGSVDFYDGKGLVEALLRSVVSAPVHTIADASLAHEAPFLHPKQSAKITVGTIDIGVLGMLHPDVRDAFDLQSDVVYASLDVEGVKLALEHVGPSQAHSLPRFPAAIRDIALLVPEDTTLAAVNQVLRDVDPQRVHEITLFDIYREPPVPPQHKSMALRILYRDPERTLAEEEVNQLHANLIEAARTKLHALQR